MPIRSKNPFLRFPWLGLLVSGLLVAPVLWRIPEFAVSSESRVLLEGDQRNLSSYEKVRSILAGVEVIVISMECAEVFSVEGIDAIRRVSDALEAQPGVVDVKSLTHSSKPVRRGLTFEMIPLVPKRALRPVELAQLKKFCLDHPLIRDVMAAADSRHTLITVTYRGDWESAQAQRQLRTELDQVLDSFRREGLRFQVLGLPLIEDEIRTSLRKDLSRLLPLALLLLMAILGAAFRSWWMVGVVLFIQALALALVIGAIEWLGFSINVFSAMLFPLSAGIHLTLLAHLCSAYQRFVRAGLTSDGALESALNSIWKPSAFAALTTGAGLASLLASDVAQIREFGLLGGMAIVIAFFATFGPGLALMLLIGRAAHKFGRVNSGVQRAGPGIGGGVVEWDESRATMLGAEGWTRFVARRRRLLIGISGVALIVMAVGLPNLRTDIRAVEFLDPTSPTRRAVEELDRVYGGINVVQIEIDSGKTNGVNELAYLKYLDEVHAYAAGRTGISGVYSYSQLLAMINQIWEGNEDLRLPTNPLVIGLFVVALRAQNFPFLTALADADFRAGYVVIRTRDMPADRYLEIISDVLRYAEENRPEGVSVSASKGIHSILEADRRILRSQIGSAGLTLVMIGLILAGLWRSWRLALIALFTNVVPIGLVLAIASFVDIPLNSVTVMVAAIALGIAVDDSIHFTTHWLEARRQGCSVHEALRASFVAKRNPIIFTSVILVVVFSLLSLSSFPPIAHFGLLSAGALALALLAVLLVLPALIGLSED